MFFYEAVAEVRKRLAGCGDEAIQLPEEVKNTLDEYFDEAVRISDDTSLDHRDRIDDALDSVVDVSREYEDLAKNNPTYQKEADRCREFILYLRSCVRY